MALKAKHPFKECTSPPSFHVGVLNQDHVIVRGDGVKVLIKHYCDVMKNHHCLLLAQKSYL